MRLLASLLTILSLVTPALAVDPKSVPVIVRDCVTKNVPTSRPVGASMTRSNHPCWSIEPTPATPGQRKVYGSSLVNGNFTVWQYNLEGSPSTAECDIKIAREKKTLKSWTNIGKGTCIPEIGLSFDWAPADRYIGKFVYRGSSDNDVVKRGATTCEDIAEIQQYLYFGDAIKVDWCEYERTKYVEWGNGTVSDCRYEFTGKFSNSTTFSPQDDCSGKRTCASAYRYHTCTKSQSYQQDNAYYYWMTAGGPVTGGAAHIASHVSIFTIMATLVMVFTAQF